MTKIQIPNKDRTEIVKNVLEGKIKLYLTPWDKYEGQYLHILPIDKNNLIFSLKKYKVRFPNPKLIFPDFDTSGGYAYKTKRFLFINDTIKNII